MAALSDSAAHVRLLDDDVLSSDASADVSVLKSLNGLTSSQPTPLSPREQRLHHITRFVCSPLVLDLSINNLVLLVSEASRGIVLGTLYAYVQRVNGGGANARTLLAIAVALFSVGRLAANTVLGRWADSMPAKHVLTLALLLHAGGQLLYTFAEPLGLWALMLSRLLVGFGSGTLGVNRAFAADLVPKEERAKQFSWLGASKFVGYALTPFISRFLVFQVNVGSMKLDEYTAPGFIMMLMCVAQAVLVYAVMSAVPPPAKPRGGTTPASCSDRLYALLVALDPRGWSMTTWGTVLFVLLNLVTKGVLTMAEASLTPDFQEAWQPVDHDNDLISDTDEFILFLGLGGLLCYVFMVTKPTTRAQSDDGVALTDDGAPPPFLTRVSTALAAFWQKCGPDADPWLLIASLLISAVGACLAAPNATPNTLPTMTAGFALIWSVGAPIADILSASMYSALISEVGGSQGSAMGAISAAGSLGRITFPLVFGFLSHIGTLTFAACASIVCAAMTLDYVLRVKRIKREREAAQTAAGSGSNSV